MCGVVNANVQLHEARSYTMPEAPAAQQPTRAVPLEPRLTFLYVLSTIAARCQQCAVGAAPQAATTGLHYTTISTPSRPPPPYYRRGVYRHVTARSHVCQSLRDCSRIATPPQAPARARVASEDVCHSLPESTATRHIAHRMPSALARLKKCLHR